MSKPGSQFQTSQSTVNSKHNLAARERKNGPIANTSQYLHFTRLQLTEASHYLCRKPKTICTDCLDLTEVRIMYKITSTYLIHSDDTQPRKFSSVQRSLTSTETIRTVRDGEFRMASSTFTQLLSSETVQRPQRPQRP